jgi:hypothetical protein
MTRVGSQRHRKKKEKNCHVYVNDALKHCCAETSLIHVHQLRSSVDVLLEGRTRKLCVLKMYANHTVVSCSLVSQITGTKWKKVPIVL